MIFFVNLVSEFLWIFSFEHQIKYINLVSTCSPSEVQDSNFDRLIRQPDTKNTLDCILKANELVILFFTRIDLLTQESTIAIFDGDSLDDHTEKSWTYFKHHLMNLIFRKKRYVGRCKINRFYCLNSVLWGDENQKSHSPYAKTSREQVSSSRVLSS